MSDALSFDLPDGTRVHWWRNPTGDEWACMAFDHGPFCRLCQRVDGTLSALLENTRMGLFEVKQNKAGEFQFRLTQKGTAHVETLLQTNPEMVELWARLTATEET